MICISVGHLQKECKTIVALLLKFKIDLDTVADYSQRTLPNIVVQAVYFVFWLSLVVGTLDNTHNTTAGNIGTMFLLVSNFTITKLSLIISTGSQTYNFCSS